MLNIGLLLSRSNIYPRFSIEVCNYLRTGIEDHFSGEWNLAIEQIGFAVNSDLVLEKAEKLILEKNVPVTIGIVGTSIMDLIDRFYEENRKAFLHFDFGANPLSISTGKYVVPFSFELWKMMYYHGLHIAEKGYKRIGLVSSFYECGYQMAEVLEHGLAKSEGEIAERIILPQEIAKEADDAIKQLKDSDKVDAIYVVANGDTLSHILHLLNEGEKAVNPVFVLPTSVNADLVKNLDENFESVCSLSKWNEDQRNRSWVEDYYEENDQLPGMIATYAYEVGSLLGKALQNCEGKHTGIRIAKELQKVKEQSGKMDKLYWSKVVDSKNVFSVIDNISIDDWEQLKIENSGMTSGWKNPYLCI